MAAIEIDLTGIGNPDEAEANRIPPGYYLAEVTDHFEDQKSDYAGSYRFEITLKGATFFAGRKLNYNYSDPGQISDPKKADGAKARVRMLASRLGLVKADDFGRAVPINFDDAIGAQLVVQVEARPSKDDLAKVYANIAYAGLFPLDHPDIPAEVRTAIGLPPAREKSASVAGVSAAPKAAGGRANGRATSASAQAAGVPAASGSPASRDAVNAAFRGI